VALGSIGRRAPTRQPSSGNLAEQEEMMDEIDIDLTFKPKDQSEAQEARAVLEAEGAREVREIEDYGFLAEGLTFLAIISAIALVNAVIKLSQLWAEGLVIDTRGERVRITPDPSVARGTVVIISGAKERVVVERPGEMSFPSLLTDVLKKGGQISGSVS
jgi:hypothetical protein